MPFKYTLDQIFLIVFSIIFVSYIDDIANETVKLCCFYSLCLSPQIIFSLFLCSLWMFPEWLIWGGEEGSRSFEGNICFSFYPLLSPWEVLGRYMAVRVYNEVLHSTNFMAPLGSHQAASEATCSACFGK